MSGRLAGKVAVVTGGSSGIGLATAERFAAEGAKVFLTGRRREELDAAVKQVGHGAVGVQGDVSLLGDLDRLYATVKAQAGRIDVLFANAGGGAFASLVEVSEAQFDREFGVNVKGALFTVQKALPLMSQGGSVILNGSIAGSKGMEAFGVYSATKAAVRSLARSFTTDLKGRGIRVNVVSPGPIDTPAIKALTGTPGGYEQFVAGMSAAVPLGRVGHPDEVAKAVLFLATEESSFVTGIELFVDGGMAQV